MEIYKIANLPTWEELGNKGIQYPLPKRNRKVKIPFIDDREGYRWMENTRSEGQDYPMAKETIQPRPREVGTYEVSPIPVNLDPTFEKMDLELENRQNGTSGVKLNGSLFCITSKESALAIKNLLNKMRDEILAMRAELKAKNANIPNSQSPI